MPCVDHAGATLHYEVHGAGPALLLAHGAGGNGLSWWQQVPCFAAHHTVVTYEHRGFGPAHAGLHDLRRVHAGAVGEEQGVADVLDLLDPAAEHR